MTTLNRLLKQNKIYRVWPTGEVGGWPSYFVFRGVAIISGFTVALLDVLFRDSCGSYRTNIEMGTFNKHYLSNMYEVTDKREQLKLALRGLIP